MDFAKINKRREQREAKAPTTIGRTKKAYAFPFMNAKELGNTGKIGDQEHFTLRVLQGHKELNPDGIGYRTTHTIELIPGYKKDGGSWIDVLGVDSYDDEHKDKARGPKLLEDVIKALDSPDIFDRLDPAVKAAVERLKTTEELLVPIIIYLKPEKVGMNVPWRDDPQYFYAPAKSDDPEVAPVGRILTITQAKLMSDLETIHKSVKNFTDYQVGRNLVLTRQHWKEYSLMGEYVESPIDPRASELLTDKKYPKIKSISQRGRYSEDQVYEFLEKSWWWDYVREFVEG